MNPKKIGNVACLSFTLILGFIGIQQGRAQAPKTAYPNMAPLDQYLMADRNAEIALALSAAPDAVSGNAKILGSSAPSLRNCRRGEERLCVYCGAGWISPSNAPEFWNPKIRGLICFNPPAARSVLPTTYKRTETVLAGRTKAEIIEGNRAAANR